MLVYLDAELVFVLGKFEVSHRESILLGTFKGLSLNGGEGGIIVGLSVSNGLLFSFKAVLLYKVIVCHRDAGSHCIELFGGPGDNILWTDSSKSMDLVCSQRLLAVMLTQVARAGLSESRKTWPVSEVMTSMMDDLMVARVDSSQSSASL
jgi:hypothetical protein